MTARRSAAKLVAVLVLALAASARAPSLRAETALGEMVDLAQLTHSLPDGFRSVGHAVSSEGLLFLSDDEQIIVWTPWGWQTLWTSRGKDDAGSVEAIACTVGVSGERLLIVTSDDVKVVSWQRKGGDASTVLGKAEYEFRLQATDPHPQLSGLAVNPAGPRPAGAALGYALDEYGALFAIRDSEIPTLDAVTLKSAVDFVVFSSSGYAFAWDYKGKTVAVLSPAGEAVGEIEVAAVLAEDDVQRRNLAVQCVWASEQRDLLCIGTSLGLAIGRLDPDSGHPDLEVQRAIGSGTAGVLALGEFCGRLLIVADSDSDGGDGGVFIEAGFVEPTPDLARFAKEVQFTVAPGPAEMGRPSEAVVTGPDVVWAKGIGGLYEWTPAGWRHLEFEVELPTPQEVSASPVVLREPFRERLWCLRPKESDAFCPASVALGRIHVNVADLCPDPSGGGVWIWDRSGSEDRGYVRFASPHAIIDNRSGTTFPADFAVARTVHRDSSGSVHIPVARNGALLLPTGKDFLLGRGGHWSETDASALAGERLLELTPGATSASAAWLAIQQAEDGSSHVVTLDLDTDSAPGSPKIIVEEVGLSCAPGANVALVPDSSGSVWFAVQENGDWRLTEILPGVGEGSSLVASGMEETPRYLFLSPVPPGSAMDSS